MLMVLVDSMRGTLAEIFGWSHAKVTELMLRSF